MAAISDKPKNCN